MCRTRSVPHRQILFVALCMSSCCAHISHIASPPVHKLMHTINIPIYHAPPSSPVVPLLGLLALSSLSSLQSTCRNILPIPQTLGLKVNLQKSIPSAISNTCRILFVVAQFAADFVRNIWQRKNGATSRTESRVTCKGHCPHAIQN